MARLHTKNLFVTLLKDAGTRRELERIARTQFKEAKREFLKDFENHEISQDIKRGEDATKSIITGVGSSFAFLGFKQGSDPVEEAVDVFDQEITMLKRPVTTNISLKFPVRFPDRQTLNARTSLPWRALSWILAIEEKAVGNLDHTLFVSRDDPPSRSRGAIQVEHKVRNASVGNRYGRKFLEPLLNKFIRRLK